MLVNEFLKEHLQVQELKTTAVTQAAAISQQRAEFSRDDRPAAEAD